MRRVVSVITGTWQRHDLLLEAIENVREQTYRPLEHIIVSDGPDDTLDFLLNGEDEHRWAEDGTEDPRWVPIRYAACGRHWSSFLAASISAVPFTVAQWLARGEYLMWLADDERMTPDHIEALVDLLESTDSDFVYSKADIWAKDDPTWRIEIGTDPPMLGTITNALFKVDLLDYRGFTTHVGAATDWDQVSAWMNAGARWAMLDRVTLSHRIDKFGEGPEFRAERRPLRGHQDARRSA